LPKKQLEPIELAVDLTFEMRRQRTPIARLQLVEPLASIAARRLGPCPRPRKELGRHLYGALEVKD
jgi:hypothetical protein